VLEGARGTPAERKVPRRVWKESSQWELRYDLSRELFSVLNWVQRLILRIPKIWDIDTGECLHVLVGHYHQIYSVAFDGIRIASGGLDTTVRVWDASTGQCTALLQGHTALVCQLQLSATSNLLATGGSDGRVITFSLDSYAPLHRIAAHDSSVTALQFDDEFLVTGGNDGRVRLWDVRSGSYVREMCEGSESVWKVGFGGGGVSQGGGRDALAIMCKRNGKTAVEIWSLRPRPIHHKDPKEQEN
jgi:F-box and WD-40 domain protein CDC4